MRRVNAILSGLGAIGGRFVKILDYKRSVLEERYDLDIRLVAACDVGGAAINPQGLDLARIATLQGRSINTIGTVGMTPLEVVRTVDADIFFEATPTNVEHGEPGLSCIRTALARRMHVVTTNKGPLAIAYRELADLARANGVQLRHSGAAMGGLPTVNLGQRDLAGAVINKIEAQANLATSYILAEMGEGLPFAEAVRAAQQQGCADADATLDVQGWDAVVKLVILANAVLGVNAKIADVQRTGLTEVTHEQIAEARAKSGVLKYIASAIRQPDGSYKLKTGPTFLPGNHPLAPLGALQMGIVYESDLYGTICASILETEPIPSASTMLRDMVAIYQK